MSRLERIRELESGHELPPLPTALKTEIPLYRPLTKPTKAPSVSSVSAPNRGIQNFQPENALSAATQIDGVPSDWITGVATMWSMSAPGDWPANIWPQTVETAQWFLERWGATAAALGWSTLDLFGAHPRAPWARHDYLGLVQSDLADRIAVMTETEARYQRGASDLGRNKKPMPADAVPIWKTYRTPFPQWKPE